MKRFITIKMCEDLSIPSHEKYTAKEALEAFSVLTKHNLRFDNKTGRLYSNDGLESKYSNPNDFIPYDNIEDVLKWVFCPYIFNSCSRVRRGYTAW